MLPIDQQLTLFVDSVKSPSQGLNRITGALMADLIHKAGGPDKLGDSDAAECLRRSSAAIGTRGRTTNLNQTSSELLLTKAGIPLKAEPAEVKNKPAK